MVIHWRTRGEEVEDGGRRESIYRHGPFFPSSINSRTTDTRFLDYTCVHSVCQVWCAPASNRLENQWPDQLVPDLRSRISTRSRMRGIQAFGGRCDLIFWEEILNCEGRDRFYGCLSVLRAILHQSFKVEYIFFYRCFNSHNRYFIGIFHFLLDFYILFFTKNHLSRLIFMIN